MKANRMMLILFTTIQVVGFSLLWSRLPNPGEQTASPNQVSIDVLTKLEELQRTQQPVSTGDGTTVVSYPQAETFRNAIRGIIKEELAVALENQTVVASAAYSPNAQAQAKSEIETPLTPEQAQKRQTSMIASRDIIDQAITEGKWDMEDVTAMTPYVNDLSSSQREELIELYLEGIGDEAMSEGVPPPPL